MVSPCVRSESPLCSSLIFHLLCSALYLLISLFPLNVQLCAFLAQIFPNLHYPISVCKRIFSFCASIKICTDMSHVGKSKIPVFCFFLTQICIAQTTAKPQHLTHLQSLIFPALHFSIQNSLETAQSPQQSVSIMSNPDESESLPTVRKSPVL